MTDAPSASRFVARLSPASLLCSVSFIINVVVSIVRQLSGRARSEESITEIGEERELGPHGRQITLHDGGDGRDGQAVATLSLVRLLLTDKCLETLFRLAGS